jgi:hypothetical protein
VRKKVLLDPLAQTTDSLTALIPRNDAAVPLDWGVQLWADASATKKKQRIECIVYSKVTRNRGIAP